MVDTVVVDHMGTKMHATIPIEVMRVMRFDVLEKNAYYICSFWVVLNNGPIKDLVLFPNSMTSDHIEDITYTVDIVRVLTSVTSEREYVRVGEVKKFVSLEITDLSMAILGDFLDGYLEVFHRRANVVALKDEFVYIYARSKILEIITTRKVGVYILWGSIVSLLVASLWWYYACVCGMFLENDPGLFFCPSCQKQVAVITPRYRLKAYVYDGHARVTLTLDDDLVSMLMDKSCQDLLTELPDPSNKIYPKQLMCLVRKNMLFKVEKCLGSSRNAEDLIKGGSGVDYIPIVNWHNNKGEGTSRPPTIPNPNVVYEGIAIKRHALKMECFRKLAPNDKLNLDYGMNFGNPNRIKGMHIFPKSVICEPQAEVDKDEVGLKKAKLSA